MKNLKLKSKILLMAFLLASGAAIASTLTNKMADDGPLYDWGPELPAATVDDAIDHFGCSEGRIECAYGIPLGDYNPVKLMKP